MAKQTKSKKPTARGKAKTKAPAMKKAARELEEKELEGIMGGLIACL